ncbi:MAG: LysR family transcriptional regulator [Burkholderiaceae bacterium]|nr:MAG: LysR family transcriptional regulator [Burkholderiaceae bacterium]
MPRALNSREIEAFRAVMQTGTTTAAAGLLHTSQPSVSRLIGQAQAASGLKLFELQKGRLRPTREALQLFDTVQRHFIGREQIEQRIATLRRSGAGQLRIGCTPALGLSVMPQALALLARRHPEVQISLHTVGTLPLREGLLHGLYDLVLTTTAIDHQQLQARRLHRSQLVCVLAPAHSLAGRARLGAADFDGEVLITLPVEDPLVMPLHRLLRDKGIAPRTTIETSYSVTVCMLALEGIGIGVVNPHVASVFADRLAIVPLRPAHPVDVFLAFAPQSAPSSIAERCAALVRQCLRLPGRRPLDETAAWTCDPLP